MSNVLKRNRAVSDAEFLHNAQVIRSEVTRLVMNEKVVPKKYRYVYAIPVIDICRELNKNAVAYYNCGGEDNSSFFLYNRKKEALYNMRDCCDNILSELQSAKHQLYFKMGPYERVVGLIVDEEDLIEKLLIHEENTHAHFVAYNLEIENEEKSVY